MACSAAADMSACHGVPSQYIRMDEAPFSSKNAAFCTGWRVASLHVSCKMDEKICLVEELHVAMQGDAVRLMGSEISEFHLVSAERAKNAGVKLHPHQYPTSSGDQNQLLC